MSDFYDIAHERWVPTSEPCLCGVLCDIHRRWLADHRLIAGRATWASWVGMEQYRLCQQCLGLRPPEIGALRYECRAVVADRLMAPFRGTREGLASFLRSLAQRVAP